MHNTRLVDAFMDCRCQLWSSIEILGWFYVKSEVFIDSKSYALSCQSYHTIKVITHRKKYIK